MSDFVHRLFTTHWVLTTWLVVMIVWLVGATVYVVAR